VFGGLSADVNVANNTEFLFPFQRDVLNLALAKKRYAAWLDCGLGKTAIEVAWAESVAKHGKVLYLCPLAVLDQIQQEAQRFIGRQFVNLRNKEKWTNGIAICNFEGMREIDTSDVVGIILDESSILKKDNGRISNWLIGLAKNVPMRLAASATPAPNDYDEYASHAVFLGLADNAKEFYSKYFRKDGVSWIIRPHAHNRFFDDLSAWSIYMAHPSRFGYKATTELPDPPNHIYKSASSGAVLFDSEQGQMFLDASDGKSRSKIFGKLRCDPNSERTKACMEFIEGKRSIIWCSRNDEEMMFKRLLGDSAVIINGTMPIEERVEWIKKYKAGGIKHLISKPTVLGFGVNLQEADCHVFSGYTYSFEQAYQAIRRSHRYGRDGVLDVLFPYTYEESPIIHRLREKMRRYDHDIRALEDRHIKNLSDWVE
jgi:superfamily II DNA or RNA helicase